MPKINLQLVKDLYPMNRAIVSPDYDNALNYLSKLLDLDIIEIPSGTKCWTWTIPQQWSVKDAWVKCNGKKVIDFKKEPMSLMTGSTPIHKKVKLKELQNNIHTREDKPDVIPHTHSYYWKDKPNWGFNVPFKRLKKFDGKEYEVFIDSEYKDGTLKIGEHTIKGKTDREILIIVHLDHPFQANDGLSQVVMAVDMAHRIKRDYKFDHTIKILFVPETIGSIAYCYTQDISNVDFVITADMVGNDGSIILQRDYDKNRKLNIAAWLALKEINIKAGKNAMPQMTEWRAIIGADEYVFSDPLINIPAVFFTKYQPPTSINPDEGYPEYHTNKDTPEIVKAENIKEVQDVILRTIEIMEADWIPKRLFKGPLFRVKYDMQTPVKETNRQLDYLIYSIDGKQSVIQLANMNRLDFNETDRILKMLKEDKLIEEVYEDSRITGS